MPKTLQALPGKTLVDKALVAIRRTLQEAEAAWLTLRGYRSLHGFPLRPTGSVTVGGAVTDTAS